MRFIDIDFINFNILFNQGSQKVIENIIKHNISIIAKNINSMSLEEAQFINKYIK